MTDDARIQALLDALRAAPAGYHPPRPKPHRMADQEAPPAALGWLTDDDRGAALALLAGPPDADPVEFVRAGRVVRVARVTRDGAPALRVTAADIPPLPDTPPPPPKGTWVAVAVTGGLAALGLLVLFSGDARPNRIEQADPPPAGPTEVAQLLRDIRDRQIDQEKRDAAAAGRLEGLERAAAQQGGAADRRFATLTKGMTGGFDRLDKAAGLQTRLEVAEANARAAQEAYAKAHAAFTAATEKHQAELAIARKEKADAELNLRDQDALIAAVGTHVRAAVRDTLVHSQFQGDYEGVAARGGQWEAFNKKLTLKLFPLPATPAPPAHTPGKTR